MLLGEGEGIAPMPRNVPTLHAIRCRLTDQILSHISMHEIRTHIFSLQCTTKAQGLRANRDKLEASVKKLERELRDMQHALEKFTIEIEVSLPKQETRSETFLLFSFPAQCFTVLSHRSRGTISPCFAHFGSCVCSFMLYGIAIPWEKAHVPCSCR